MFREFADVAALDEHPELAEITLANGMTMLHQGVCHGTLLITKWQLDHGADVNRRGTLALYHGATFLPNSPQGWSRSAVRTVPPLSQRSHGRIHSKRLLRPFTKPPA
jgi:hypothetical protein